ncbi:MAG: hypothetical protein GOMPHAMPRED_007042 [Gomphillus americanus]|uniref:GTP-binding protein EsdC n=1 Tax=Gomphillus americanus TaxID=1940652 RepID=A0A8H3I7J3_9LECA|nr:MAG: hypothetical protein GOMPHAMPRED_007042 [Gomphillus americanus]
MAALQLTFTLRTTPNAKTVHLVGNWDGYKGQLPLSKESSKSGSWKGTFRFQQSTLTPGKRYWYYYIMDGYQVAHDPAKPSTREPTTGRQLNILDVPKVSSASGSSSTTISSSNKLSSSSHGILPSRQGLGIQIPTGRGLSPSRIISPKPSKPYASRAIREADYSRSPIDDLSSRLSHTRLFTADNRGEDDYPSSPSATSSLSSRSGGSSPSSLSSLSDRSASSCRCNRFGITRRGDKVRLDCGGSRCGYSDDSSSCCSDESEDERQRRPRLQQQQSSPSSSSKSKTAAAAAVKPRVQEIRPRAGRR